MIILGWAFSKDRQVSRFSDVHNLLGHNTLTYTVDPRTLFTLDRDEQR